MKRTYCGEDNDRESDSSLLDLHFQPDECENESSKNLKTMTDTTAIVKNENLLPSQEITETCDNVITHQYVTDYSEVPESHIKGGKIIILFLQNNMEVQNCHKLEFYAVSLNLCVIFDELMHFRCAK